MTTELTEEERYDLVTKLVPENDGKAASEAICEVQEIIDEETQFPEIGHQLLPGVIVLFIDKREAMRFCSLAKQLFRESSGAHTNGKKINPDYAQAIKHLPGTIDKFTNSDSDAHVIRECPVYISDAALKILTQSENLEALKAATIENSTDSPDHNPSDDKVVPLNGRKPHENGHKPSR